MHAPSVGVGALEVCAHSCACLETCVRKLGCTRRQKHVIGACAGDARANRSCIWMMPTLKGCPRRVMRVTGDARVGEMPAPGHACTGRCPRRGDVRLGSCVYRAM